MARTYRYLFCDLRTDTLLAELPCQNVSFDIQLNGAGGFQGQIPLDGSDKIVKLDPLNATQEARSYLWIEVDGVLVWGGLVWTSGFDSSQGYIQLNGNETWSYFKHQKLRGGNYNYANIDQLAIARDILAYVQARLGPVVDWRGSTAGGDIGVTLGNETCGVLRTRVYNLYEEKEVGLAVEELSQVQNGFDFVIEVGYVNGVRTKTFRPSYPRRGVSATNSGFVWEYPGSITNFRVSKDGTMMTNWMKTLGAGSAENMLTSQAFDGASIDLGYPRLDGTTSHGDVVVQSTLDAWSLSEQKAVASPIVFYEVDVRGDKVPTFGTYQVGDEARFRLGGPYFYKGVLDTFFRIYNIKVSPQEKGQPEKITFVLGPTFQAGS